MGRKVKVKTCTDRLWAIRIGAEGGMSLEPASAASWAANSAAALYVAQRGRWGPLRAEGGLPAGQTPEPTHSERKRSAAGTDAAGRWGEGASRPQPQHQSQPAAKARHRVSPVPPKPPESQRKAPSSRRCLPSNNQNPTPTAPFLGALRAVRWPGAARPASLRSAPRSSAVRRARAILFCFAKPELAA